MGKAIATTCLATTSFAFLIGYSTPLPLYFILILSIFDKNPIFLLHSELSPKVSTHACVNIAGLPPERN